MNNPIRFEVTTSTVINCVFIISTVIPFESVFAQETWEHHFFTSSDDVQLHYIAAGLDSGTTDPESPIVFVPGWTMPAWIWEYQINHFSQHHKVYAFDPRGQGDSEKPPFGYDHSRRARDIAELVSELQTGPVILVGWSLGVLEVIKYLEDHGTQAVRATVLVDWSMYYDDPMGFSDRFVSLQTEREEWTSDFVDAIYASDQSADYLDRVTQAALSTPTNAAAIMIGNIILQGQTDLRPFMDVLDIPALFVYSSNDWSKSAAQEIREGWPRFQVEVIDESSHVLFVDQPAAFNRVLADFIASLSE